MMLPPFTRALSRWALWLWLGLSAVVAMAQPGQRFVAVGFHDVVDRAADLDEDSVTTDRLVAFFDQLRADGWTAISLDDIARARSGVKPLPDRAILITFDDGYASLYSRVFPLALAYQIPIVAALVGEWVDAPAGTLVQYAGRAVTREHFISWDQAREMQASGLVEFASHTYRHHKGLLANPQGNLTPAVTTAPYDPASQTYETASQFRDRFRQDVIANRDLFVRELGRKPRAVVWPFGRYSLAAIEVIQSEGLQFALSLQDELSETGLPFEISRYYPRANQTLADLLDDLRFSDRLPAAQRLVRVDPGRIWSADPAEFDRRLGALLDQLLVLGVTGVILDAVVVDPATQVVQSWFPSPVLPLRGDALNRLAWQIRTRTKAMPIADTALATLSQVLTAEQILQLHDDLGRLVPIDAIVFREQAILAQWRQSAQQRVDSTTWSIRAARRAVQPQAWSAPDRLALEAFRRVEIYRPTLKLVTVNSLAPRERLGDLTDLQLYRIPPEIASLEQAMAALRAGGLLGRQADRRRVGLWIEAPETLDAKGLASLVRRFQTQGGTAVGWSSDRFLNDPAEAVRLAPTVSSETFPIRF